MILGTYQFHQDSGQSHIGFPYTCQNDWRKKKDSLMKQNENSDFFENLVENSNLFMNILFLCLLVWYWMLSYEYDCIYHVYNPNLYFLSSFNWQKARILKSITNPDIQTKQNDHEPYVFRTYWQIRFLCSTNSNHCCLLHNTLYFDYRVPWEHSNSYYLRV